MNDIHFIFVQVDNTVRPSVKSNRVSKYHIKFVKISKGLPLKCCCYNNKTIVKMFYGGEETPRRAFGCLVTI